MDREVPEYYIKKKLIEEYDYNPENDINFTSIIIFTHNKLEYTIPCIESIRKFTSKDSYELIVVDNNSSDGTVSWIKEQNDITGIYNNIEVNLSKGYNQGIQIAKGKSILLLSNETIVTPKWLNNLDKALYSSDDIGAVSPISNSNKNCDYIKVNYTQLGDMIEFAKEHNKLNDNLWNYKTKLSGFCYLMKRKIIDNVGVLDENLMSGDYETYDLSLRMLLGGYRLLLCKDTFIHQMISQNQLNARPIFADNKEGNRLKLNEKWGFNVSYNSQIGSDLNGYISGSRNRKLNILEIGCGAGETLLNIKNIYKNANIYGVEKCKKASDVAKTFSNTICEDIETLEMPYEEEFFDYIILEEVIECLSNPWNFLKKIKKYLKKSGYIIVIISNVMNVDILKNLINGSFTYEEDGVIKYEYLRFFTLQNISKLCEENKLAVSEIRAIMKDPSQQDENFINKLCMLSSNEYKLQYQVNKYVLKLSNIMSFDEFI